MSTEKPQPTDYTIIVDFTRGTQNTNPTILPPRSMVDKEEMIVTTRGRSIFVVAIGGDAIIKTSNLGAAGDPIAHDYLKGNTPIEIKIADDVSRGPDHSIEIDYIRDDDSDDDPYEYPFPIIIDVE